MEYDEILFNQLVKLRLAHCMPTATVYEDGRVETSDRWTSEEAHNLYNKMLKLREERLNQMVDNAALCIGPYIAPRGYGNGK
jgi:hypothetical protein